MCRDDHIRAHLCDQLAQSRTDERPTDAAGGPDTAGGVGEVKDAPEEVWRAPGDRPIKRDALAQRKAAALPHTVDDHWPPIWLIRRLHRLGDGVGCAAVTAAGVGHQEEHD